MEQNQSEKMDEKLVCSLIVKGDQEQSVRGSFDNQMETSLSMEKQSMLTDVGNCQVVGSQSINISSSQYDNDDSNN